MALWTPANIANDKIWYVSDNPANSFSGGFLSVLADKGPNARHASAVSASTVAAMPNTLNGRPVIRNDSGSSTKKGWFQTPPNNIINAATGTTCVHVARASELDAAGKLHHLDTGDNYHTKSTVLRPGPSGQGLSLGGRRVLSDSYGDLVDSTSYGSAWLVIVGWLDWITGWNYLRVNGTQTVAYFLSASASAYEAVDSAHLTIGTDAEMAWPADGDIAEQIIIRNAVTATEVEQLEGYVAWQWGLQGNLPSGHTYKTAPPSISGLVEGAASWTADSAFTFTASQVLNGILAADGVNTIPFEGAKLRGGETQMTDNPGAIGQYTPPNGPGTSYFPVGAYRVPVSQRANLQNLLDTYGVIRLDAGDYASGGVAELTVKSGQGVYGIPGVTAVPKVTIQPGTAGATVKGVWSGPGINFPASAAVTKNNAFGMCTGKFIGTGATLESNLFACIVGNTSLDNTSGGYARFNRWVRMHTHGAGYDGYPAFRLLGAAGRTSYGNAIVAVNALDSTMTGLDISGQADFSVVGLDAEDYSPHTDGKGLVYVRDVGRFNIIGLQGTSHQTDGLDIGADKSNLIASDLVCDPAYTTLRLTSTAAAAAMWRYRTDGHFTDAASSPLRLADTPNTAPKLNGSTTPPSGLNASLSLDLIASDISTTQAWGKVAERAVWNPAGAGWASGIGSNPDETVALQMMCDASLVVELEPRPYYLTGTTPIKLRQGAVIVGVAGATVLISKSSSVHMFETKYSMTGGSMTGSVSFIDVVLQGGRSGLHLNESGTQITSFYLVNTVFRDMSEAGIFIDNCFGLDNGWLENVDFVNCPAGIKQRGTGGSTEPTIAYIDKTNFFRCQFINCALPIDFLAGRANNLNTWTECLFKDSTSNGVLLLGANNTPIFTNCQFTNCGGTVVVEAYKTSVLFVRCGFVGSAANSAMVGPYSLLEGCTIEKGTSTSATIFNLIPPEFNVSQVLASIFNTVSELPLGPIDSDPAKISLLSVNSLFPSADGAWSKPVSVNIADLKGTYDTGDDTRISALGWLDGQPTPGTRFLRDAGAGSGAGANNIAFNGTGVQGGTAAASNVGDVAGDGGRVVGGAWAALGDFVVGFDSNLIAAGEGELTAVGDMAVMFVGSSIAGTTAAIDGTDNLQFFGGMALAAGFDVSGDGSGAFAGSMVRSAVATLVADAIVAWQYGTVPGSGAGTGPAPMTRRMYRSSNSRSMTRLSQPRKMTR